jgi:glycosyltransferase involved in cell wall biosynthesis
MVNSRLISVITVVKNDVVGLRLTIDSLSKLDFVERIIVDGGSKDGSAELAEAHSDLKIQSKEDGGIYQAMQRGASKAESRYIIFINAGDSLFSGDNLLKAIYELESSGTEWGFGPIVEKSTWGTSFLVNVPGEISTESISRRSTYVPFPSVIMRNDLFQSVIGFNTEFKIAGDFELVIRLAKSNLPTRWDFPLVVFEAGGVSYTSAPKAWLEEIRARKLNDINCGIINEITKLFFKVTRWSLGQILDKLQASKVLGKTHWRERMRANEIMK